MHAHTHALTHQHLLGVQVHAHSSSPRSTATAPPRHPMPTAAASSAPPPHAHRLPSVPHRRLASVAAHLRPTSSMTTSTSTTTTTSLTAGTTSTSATASEHLVVRPLQRDDDARGFLTLLAQLTQVGDIDHARFVKRFEQIDALHSTHRICVTEDTLKRRIVATATLIVEYKFIHGISQIGHIEDVVVSSEYRGQNLGGRIVTHLIELARLMGCYKVILDCSASNRAFYERFGFREHQHHMALYFAEQQQRQTGDSTTSHASHASNASSSSTSTPNSPQR